MAVRIVSAQDGTRLNVSDMVKSPTLIPERTINMMDQHFIVDYLLRDAGGVPSGVILYRESDPLYADSDAEVVEEFGEIPLVTISRGLRKVARTVKRAFGILVSQEMIDRNDTGEVNRQITVATNTMTRTWENVFLSLVFSNPGIPTMAVGAPWGSGTERTRKDLALGKLVVNNADADSNNGTGTNKFGFRADTLVVNMTTAAAFEYSDDVAKPYLGGNIADENPQYIGTLPRRYSGLTVMASWQMPANKALLLQAKTIGGIADERPLHATPLREQANNTETWRSNVIRRSAIFIDQPKAACILTGVDS